MSLTGRSPSGWRGWTLALGTLALSSAAQSASLPDRWMDWRVLPFYPRAGCEVSKSLGAEMVSHLEQLALAFARAGPPLSTKAYVQPTVGASSEGGCEPAPVAGSISLALWEAREVLLHAGTAERPTLRPHHSESDGALDLHINRLPQAREVDFVAGNENTAGITLYQPTSLFQGYPVIDHHLIVIVPPGHPPLYVPVPLEQALRLAVAYHVGLVAAEVQNVREDAARSAEGGDFAKAMKAAGVSREQLQKLQADSARLVDERLQRARATLALLQGKLAQLTPAMRSAPTYVTRDASEVYLPQAGPEPDAVALVMPNPAYFDARVARSVPQLLVLNLPYWIDEPGRPDASWQWQAVQAVDWRHSLGDSLH